MTEIDAGKEVASQDESSISDEKGSWSDWAYWALPMAVACLLCGLSLDLNSLSHDELSTWSRTEYGRLPAVLTYGVGPDFHPPGHFILIWLIKQVGFESEVALRLPSVIAAVLSVGVLSRIGGTLFDRWTGCVAALLMATSWSFVYYAQDARSYAAVVLFCLVAIDASIAVVRTLNANRVVGRGAWIRLIVSGSLAAYFHYYGLFFVAFLGLGCGLVLLPNYRALLRVWLGFAAIGLTYIPWLPALMEDLGHSSTWVMRHGTAFFPQWWTWVFGEADIPSLMAVAAIVVGAVMALQRNGLRGRRWAWTPTLLVFVWLVGPGLFAFIKSMLSTPALTKKNILMCAPALHLLVAYGLRQFPDKGRVRYIATGALLVALVWDLVGVKDYYRETTKREYRGAVRAMVEHGGDFTIGRCGIGEHFAYYLKQQGSSLEIDKNLCREKQLEGFIDRMGDQELFFVRAHYRPDDAVRDYLDDTYTSTTLFQELGAVAMVLTPRAGVDSAQPDVAGDAPVDTGPVVEGACPSAMGEPDRTRSWSMWPDGTGQSLSTTEKGLLFERDSDTSERVNVCLKQRIPVSGLVEFSGTWSAQLGESGDAVQLSAQFWGDDEKLVAKTETQKPVMMVKTTSTSMGPVQFKKVLEAPPDAVAVQLCIRMLGKKGNVGLSDLCVHSPD